MKQRWLQTNGHYIFNRVTTSIPVAASSATRSYLLRQLLSQVSRSFYLTLVVLPVAVRDQIGLAYLFARAADTIADTSLISQSQRLVYLQAFQGLFMQDTVDWPVVGSIRSALVSHQALPGERVLLERLEDCFRLYLECEAADRALIRRLMITLTKGMEMDLTRFTDGTPEHPQSLATMEELDLYTYYVAGCVGEFWTAITCAYLPALAHWQVGQMSEAGMRYGKGLQLTNIVKDIARDLRLGRCYIPESLLAPAGLTPELLLEPETRHAFQPVLAQLVRQAMEYLDEGWRYTMAIPSSEVRLRLACMWPILFGGETLALVQRSSNILDPDNTVRISRGCVYRIMALTILTGASGYVGTACWKNLQRQAG